MNESFHSQWKAKNVAESMKRRAVRGGGRLIKKKKEWLWLRTLRENRFFESR